jgi:hypothetical protein
LPIGSFRVVILEADHPLACRRLGGAPPDRSLDLADRAQVAINIEPDCDSIPALLPLSAAAAPIIIAHPSFRKW